jgi:starch phosphorylase
VTKLYLPAAKSSHALASGGPGFAGARELAAWKDRVAKAWPAVAVEHVEGDDGEQSPGAKLMVRASVALGALSPDDVTVQAVYGPAWDDDEISSPAFADLELEEEPANGSAARYSGEVELGRPGPFGYTVRVLPRHPLLASPAEMGLITLPDAPVGMTNGDLR